MMIAIMNDSNNSSRKNSLHRRVKICIDCGSINVSKEKDGLVCNNCKSFRKYFEG